MAQSGDLAAARPGAIFLPDAAIVTRSTGGSGDGAKPGFEGCIRRNGFHGVQRLTVGNAADEGPMAP